LAHHAECGDVADTASLARATKNEAAQAAVILELNSSSLDAGSELYATYENLKAEPNNA